MASEDADRLYDALALPRDALVERRVPKSTLVEQGQLSPADRRLTEAGIERLTWRATVQPFNTGVAAFSDAVRDYAQIVVMAVELRPGTKSERLVEVIHRAIAHPLLLVCDGAEGASLSTGIKRRHEREAGRVVVERIAASPPVADCPGAVAAPFLASLALAAQAGSNLWSLHEGWAGSLEALQVAQVTGAYSAPANADEAAERREALAAFRTATAEALRLRKAAGAERRLNRRIELANAARQAAAEAERLKAHLS